MGLKANYQLITPDLKARHREIVLDNSKIQIKENLIRAGQKTRYKKGDIGHIKVAWSEEAIAQLKKRGKKQLTNLWRFRR